jgi:hypothetical protein
MADARFPIQRAPEKLGVVPTTAVRANLDVRTGGQELAGAIAGFGGAIANLGMKYYDIQATTQRSWAERLAVEEMNRLSLSFEGNLDPETYMKEYEKSLKTIQSSTGAILTNRKAVANFGLFLNSRQPRWENSVKEAQKARILDNRIAEVFNKQTEIRQSGIYGKFSEFIAETVRNVDGFDKSDGARIIAQTKRMAAAGAELNLIDSYWQKAKKMPINQANEFINDARVLTGAQRNDLIARRKRQEEIVTATTNRKVRWDTLREVTKSPQTVTDEWLESLVKPNSLTWDDAEEFKKIRDDKAEPLKTPRAQLYFNSLDELFDKRETDADERMKWDIANEKLVQYFKENPNATAKQAAEFYDDLISDEVEGIFNKAFNIWLQSPFGILGRKVLGVKKEGGEKSPYPEYPDAFLEDGVWKVIKGGKKYRIE